jgi:hypothetical protein
MLDLTTERSYGCVGAYFVFLCPVYGKNIMLQNRVNNYLILAVYVTFQIMDFWMLN